MSRGGPRPGAGRPKGSRDKILRRNQKFEDKTRAMQETEVYLRSNGATMFDGDAVTFLTAVYRDDGMPLPLRFQAALAVAPYETPRMTDVRAAVLEQRAKEISQAELKAQQDAGDARLDELIAMYNQFVADREAEIGELLEADALP